MELGITNSQHVGLAAGIDDLEDHPEGALGWDEGERAGRCTQKVSRELSHLGIEYCGFDGGPLSKVPQRFVGDCRVGLGVEHPASVGRVAPKTEIIRRRLRRRADVVPSTHKVW